MLLLKRYTVLDASLYCNVCRRSRSVLLSFVGHCIIPHLAECALRAFDRRGLQFYQNKLISCEATKYQQGRQQLLGHALRAAVQQQAVLSAPQHYAVQADCKHEGSIFYL
jgi:hypothetical protein